MGRLRVAMVAAVVLGVVTTVGVAWAFAAIGRAGATGQSVYVAPDRRVSFGRSDGWGNTRLYWTAMLNDGGAWGTHDDLYELPSWSAVRGAVPLGKSEDFPKTPQTFEVATGWPWRAMRAEFRDYPQGTPRPASGPYVTVSGITLPNRRVNGAILAAALPYDVIWPGFVGDAAIYAAYWLALLAGVPAARRVLRAARTRCLACGYDVSGTPRGAVCSECGAAVEDSRRLGRWWPVVPVAAAVMIAIAAAAPSLAWAESRGFTVERILPVWSLRHRAGGSAGSVALDELIRRVESKSLGAAALREVVADALAAQADGARPWNYRWGNLVESAHQNGTLEAEQWAAYAKGAVRLMMTPRARVRVGDCVPMRIDMECRVGRGSLLGLQVGAAPPSLDGVAGSIEPNADPKLRLATPETKPRIGTYGNGQLYPFDAAQRGGGWSLTPPDTVGRVLRAYEMVWPRAQRVGTSEVAIDLDVSIVENAYAPGPVFPGTRPTSTKPMAEYTVTLKAPVRVVEAGVETVRLVTPREAEAAIGQIEPVTAANATAWAKPPFVQRNGEFFEAHGAINLPKCPVAMSFEIVWRRGEKEWVIASFAVEANHGATGRGYFGIVEGFEPGPIEIVLRPSVAAARNDPEIEEIWGREVVVDGGVVEGPK